MDTVNSALELAKEILEREKVVAEKELDFQKAIDDLDSLKKKFARLFHIGKSPHSESKPTGKGSTSTDKVVSFIYGTDGKTFSTKDVCENVEATPNLVRNVIFKLRKQGKILSENGQYKLATDIFS